MATESAEEVQARLAREHAARQSVGAQGVPVGGKVLSMSVHDTEIGDRNMHILDSLKPGEPIIIFRAKDILSVMVIVEYQNLIEKYGTDTELQAAVHEKLQEFRIWQQQNPQHIRLPD